MVFLLFVCFDFFFQPTCFTPRYLINFVFLLKESGKNLERGQLLPCYVAFSPWQNTSSRRKERLLGSSCKGRIYLEYSRKATLWGISWVSGGQWLPAVVWIRNMCLKYGLELWVLHPPSPALCVSVNQFVQCVSSRIMYIYFLYESPLKEKTPQLLEWKRTWNRFEDCTGKIIQLNLLLERILFSAAKGIIQLLPLPSSINPEQKYFSYEMYIFQVLYKWFISLTNTVKGKKILPPLGSQIHCQGATPFASLSSDR